MTSMSLRVDDWDAARARVLSVASTAAPAVPMLELKGVAKGFGTGSQRREVLREIDLAIAEGELVAIVGLSGSGKSTLVSLMAGLMEADAGTIRKRGMPVYGPGPDRGVVFQSYSLLPWRSVYENVALAVDQVFPQLSAADRRARTWHYVKLVNLAPAAHRRPAQLSGGMRQRVAVARALALDPDVLLLDEPLSALDALTRANLQEEILRIWSDTRKTIVLVTNDIDEAIFMADRIVPLEPGPRASLGPSFSVGLERPRDRTALNHDAQYKRLRREVTEYLAHMAEASGTGRSSARIINLPDLKPRASRADPVVREAARSRERRGDERYVEFSRVTKTYPTRKGPIAVVEDFDLRVRKGEFVALIGHSGCGKSTVLSMVAGLNDVSSGGIVLDQREVTAAGPDRGIVFQAPSVFPWMTAFENVTLGVERVYPHASRAEQRLIVGHHLEGVGLGDALHRRAASLSNGMQQRVGIARAFALSPKLLLLDEPFGMLDSFTRWQLQEVLLDIWARTRVTAIMVTHDVDEAILLADRVVMMTSGPRARVGGILDIDLPRPRTRKSLLTLPGYYKHRESLLAFLAGNHHGDSAASAGS